MKATHHSPMMTFYGWAPAKLPGQTWWAFGQRPSSPLLLSQTVMVTTNGADFSAPCLFGETVAHHSLGHTGFLLRNQLPLELPFLVPQFRAGSPSCQVRCSSEGFGSSIFFGAKPIRYTVKPSQTSYQKKGGSFPIRCLATDSEDI